MIRMFSTSFNKKDFVLLFFGLFFVHITASAKNPLEFFPRENYLNFRPLAANIFEPRMGFFFYDKSNKLRLDIGSSYDIKVWKKKFHTFAVGADMFTLTQLRSAGRMKFPVETTDFYFGVNGSYNAAEDQITWHHAEALDEHYLKNEEPLKNFSVRFRLAHISSHLVDGMANDSIFTRKPFVYSREFAELIAAYNFGDIRVYAGGTFVFSTIPKEVHKWIPQIGADCYLQLPDSFYYDLVGGIDLRADGYDGKDKLTISGMVGFNCFYSNNSGILLSINFMNGKNFHGMFYKDNFKEISFGIQVYFR